MNKNKIIQLLIAYRQIIIYWVLVIAFTLIIGTQINKVRLKYFTDNEFKIELTKK